MHDKQPKVVLICSALELFNSGLQVECEVRMTVQGFLSSPYTATYYTLAQRHPEVPLLTQKQHEALRMYNALALSDRLRLDLMLQPGDIQLLSNHTQLHTRSAFIDYPVGNPCLEPHHCTINFHDVLPFGAPGCVRHHTAVRSSWESHFAMLTAFTADSNA